MMSKIKNNSALQEQLESALSLLEARDVTIRQNELLHRKLEADKVTLEAALETELKKFLENPIEKIEESLDKDQQTLAPRSPNNHEMVSRQEVSALRDQAATAEEELIQLRQKTYKLNLDRDMLNSSLELLSQSLETAKLENLKMRDDYEREQVLILAEKSDVDTKVRNLQSDLRVAASTEKLLQQRLRESPRITPAASPTSSTLRQISSQDMLAKDKAGLGLILEGQGDQNADSGM